MRCAPDQSSASLSPSEPRASEQSSVEAGHVERAMSDHALISREEAIAQGLKYFFTGKPCYWGHVAPRYIMGRTSTCGECKQINDWNQADKRKEVRLVPATEEELAELRKRGRGAGRSVARALGLKHFYSDKPCKRGHTELRLVQNGSCVQCMDESHARYRERKRLAALPRPKPIKPPTPIKVKPPKPPKPAKPPKSPKLWSSQRVQLPKLPPKPKSATTTALTKWLVQQRAEKAEGDKRWAEHVAAKKARVDARLGEI